MTNQEILQSAVDRMHAFFHAAEDARLEGKDDLADQLWNEYEGAYASYMELKHNVQ